MEEHVPLLHRASITLDSNIAAAILSQLVWAVEDDADDSVCCAVNKFNVLSVIAGVLRSPRRILTATGRKLVTNSSHTIHRYLRAAW